MGSSKGFVFSLDAFVAFTLALVAIYSLIFFSSVPSGYYSALSQAHILAKDTLTALADTKCTFAVCDDNEVNVLQHIIFRSRDPQGAVQSFIGSRIPEQFGYKFEVFKDGDADPSFTYDTKDNALDLHNKKRSKLSVSTSMVVFQYVAAKPAGNPFSYNTCHGTEGQDICRVPNAEDNYVRDYAVKVVKLTVYI